MYQTIHEAAAAMKEGKVTPIELVEQCLAAIDEWEPKVKAWVFVDRDYARAEAKRLTEELSKGRYRGPLHGIPIGVKDIFDVFDWPTAAGSKLWANSIARQDAPIIRNLRAAGCIFLGKTVTTLFASFDPPVTRNPWNLERTPGGSSSGSAAAVSTLMCLGALGSQTGGSITRPASYCGVCGLKPTYGLMPLEGIVPLAWSMDHPGPIGRCVRDLALLFQEMAITVPYPLVNANMSSYVKGLGIYMTRLGGIFETKAEPSTLQMMGRVMESLERKIQFGEQALPPTFAEVLPRHRTIMAVEAAQFHEHRFRRHPEDYQPRIRELIEEGLSCPATEYHHCIHHKCKLEKEIDECFSAYDAVLTPATRDPAPERNTTGDPALNSPWSYTGLPTVSLPTGKSHEGLPLAIQIVGQRNAERKLLRIAALIEEILDLGPLTPPRPS